LGYCWHKSGDERKAKQAARKGAALPIDLCFPFRLEEIDVLRWAMQADPLDAKAAYYLGNLLYDIQPEEAVNAWERSRELDGTCALVHRNLSQAYADADEDKSRAIESLERALQCGGRDPRHYSELDKLLEEQGVPHAKRLARLEAAHDVVTQRDYSLLREISLHVQVGQYDRALEFLAAHHFHIWEGMEHSVHDVYADAHLLKGRQLARNGRWAEALAHYLAAARYPERFELGEPHDGGRAAEFCWFAATAYDAMGDPSQARSALQRAVEKPKKGTYLAYYQGLALRKLGQEQPANDLFDDLVKVGTDLAEGRKGSDFFEKFAARQTPAMRQAQGHYLRGLGLLGKGRKAEAHGEFQSAVQWNMNHLHARVMLAETA
jgi:tetratricopeptide (TPR) repeat protein